MAEETQTQSGTEQASETANETQTEDYKAKYEELQGKHQQTVEELQSAKGTLDTLDQYGAINWDTITGTQQKVESGEEEPQLVDSKTVERKLREVQERNENQILTLQFRVDNPDLREYEENLVIPEIIRVRRANPRISKEKILEKASENVRKFLTEQEKKFEAKKTKAKAEEDALKASGLEAAGSTSPKTEPTSEEMNKEYIENRQKAINKKKGL